MGTADGALVIDRLSKRFGDHRVLDEVSLSVAPGEIFGLLGPNGAGKTTLLRVITSLIFPTSGSVRLLGAPVPTRYRDVAPRVGAAVGEPRVYRGLSASENVTVAAHLSGRRVSRDEVAEVLGAVRLDGTGRARARTFSTGMVQRLSLAMTLICRPDVLILDEPTSGMDPRGLSEMRALFRSRRAEGATIILSSHQTAEVEALADRVGFLVDGRLVALVAPPDLAAEGVVHLTVRNVRSAKAALKRAGVDAVVGPGIVSCRASVEQALRALYAADIVPSGVREERASLEGLFLDLVSSTEMQT